MDKLITVLTPTYNRASLLVNLFDSLNKQDVKNFAWLIIDDGSNDDTEKVVNSFAGKNLDVRYYRKPNGGKHTAINFALQYIDTPLTIIVDSDDILLPYATKEIAKYYSKYEKMLDNLSAFSFLRCYQDGKPIVNLDKEEFVANYIDYRIKKKHPGDMAEVFNSEILKKYSFPEYHGERFISEDVLWIEIGKSYNYVFINKPIYQCEYLQGGLTDNDKKVKFLSPIGSMMRGKQLMTKRCGFVSNVRGAIIYNCYALETDRKDVKPDSLYERALITVTKPLGRYYNEKWKKSYLKQGENR